MIGGGSFVATLCGDQIIYFLVLLNLHFCCKTRLHCLRYFEQTINISYFYFDYNAKNFEPLWSPQVEFKAISDLFEIQDSASVQRDF